MGERKGKNRKSFSRDSKPGRKASGKAGRNSRPDRKDSGRLEMHRVVCDSCGEQCEVPFRPTSSKPVYCSDCYRKKEGSGGQKQGVTQEDIAMINMKLDKIMKALKIR